MSEPSVIVAKDARGVATVAIKRPQVRNAIDDTVIRSLTDAFKTLGADGETRVVVLTGRGVAFSAGADLDWMRRMAGGSEADNLGSGKTSSAMLRALNELPKPTIAKVNGAAYAAGIGLVAACDIAVAAEEAVFSISEVRIGLVPSTISPYVLAAIGARAARRYFLTGEPFSAADACRLGLVHKVVPQTGLDEAIEGVISALLAGGPHSQSRVQDAVAALARKVDAFDAVGRGKRRNEACEAIRLAENARAIAERREIERDRNAVEKRSIELAAGGKRGRDDRVVDRETAEALDHEGKTGPFCSAERQQRRELPGIGGIASLRVQPPAERNLAPGIARAHHLPHGDIRRGHIE